MTFDNAKELTGWNGDSKQSRESMISQGAHIDTPDGFNPCAHRIEREGVEYAAVLSSTSRWQAYYSLYSK